MQDLRYRFDNLMERLDGGQPGRAKLIFLSAATAIVVLWLLINIVPGFFPEGQTKPIDTPGWRVAGELNEKLVAKPEFAGAGFTVESESPLTLKVVGGVSTYDDLDELKEFVKEIRPEGDYTVDVMVFDAEPE